MESQPTHLTSNERWLAALAHGSALLSIFGPLVPGLVWISLRRKSRYVAFQSLQAMGYQALLLWVGLSLALIGMLVFIFTAGLQPTQAASMEALMNGPLMARASLFERLFYVLWAALCMPGIIGALFALTGREFYYPILGRRLEARLKPGSAAPWFDEGREEDWVAGIGHASAVVLFWGMLFPWLVWSLTRDASPRLRFQSLQAFLYQLLMLIANGTAFIVLTVFALLVVALAGYMNSAAGISSDAGLYLLIAVFAMMLLMAVMLLALPAFHLFALIAWVRVSRGADYLYPILGRMLQRKMTGKAGP